MRNQNSSLQAFDIYGSACTSSYVLVFHAALRKFESGCLYCVCCLLLAGNTFSAVSAQDVQNSDYLIQRAINSLSNNNLESAKKHFRAAQEAGNNTAQINLTIGELFIEYAENGYEHALPYLLAALARNPELLRAQLLAGQAYFNQRSFRDARKIFEFLLEQQGYEGYSLFYLGIIDYQQRKYESAREKLQRVLGNNDMNSLHASTRSYLDAIDVVSKRLSAYLNAVFRYDSNPQTISEIDIAAPEFNPEQNKDIAFIVLGQTNYTLYQYADKKVSALYRLYNLRYDRLDELDQRGHTVELNFMFYGHEYSFNTEYGYEKWSVNENTLQQLQRISTSVVRGLTPNSETEIEFQLRYINRSDDASLSGPVLKLSLSHLHDLSASWRAGLGYKYERFDTKRNLKTQIHNVSLNLHLPEILRFQTRIGVDFEYKNYHVDEPQIYRDHEENTRIFAVASRSVMRNTHVQMRVAHETNSSDDDSFSFERSQFDAGLVFQF